MAINMGTAVAYLELDTSRFTSGFTSAIKDLKVFGDKSATVEQKTRGLSTAFGKMGSALTRGVSVPLAAVGTGAVMASAKFESAFAGVRKTVDATESQFGKIRKGIEELATSSASSAEEIAGVAEVAGQLGVKADDITQFTETMVRLGDSTNIAAADAASALAQLFNITGENIKNVDKFGSTLVKLGNNAATTENDIMNMATRIAGSASQVGFTSQEILGLSTAMSSVGLSAEAGGTAISTIISNIDKQVATNGKNLETWAQTAGMSTEQFAQAWEQNAYSALQMVIEGMSDTRKGGENLNILLEELGVTNIRTSDTMKRLSGASESMGEYLNMANGAWEENTALVDESNQRYETTVAKLNQAKESIKQAGRALGDILLPYVQQAAEYVSNLTQKFAGMTEEQRKTIVKIGAFAVALGPVMLILSKVLGVFSGFLSILPKLISAFGIVSKVFTNTRIVMDTMRTAGVGLSDALKITGNSGSFLAKAIDGSKNIMLKFNSVIGKLHNALVFLVKDPIGAFKIALTAVKGALTSILTPLNIVIGVVGILAASFISLWKNNEEFRDKIIGTWNDIKSKIDGFVQGIVERINELGFDFENITELMSAAWKGFTDIVAPLFTGAFNLISDVLGGIFESILGVVDIFVGVFTGDMEQVAKGIGEVFNGVLETATSLVGDIFKTFGDVGAQILEKLGFEEAAAKFEKFFNALGDGIKKLPELIGIAVDKIVEFFTETIPEAFNAFGEKIQTFFTETIPEAFNSAIDGISSFKDRLVEFFTVTIPEAFSTFVNETVPNFIEQIATWFAQLPERIGIFIGEMIGHIYTFGQNIVTWVTTELPVIIESIINWFAQLPSRIWEWLTNVITNIITWGSDMYNKAVTYASNFVNAVITFIQQLPGKIWTWLSNVISRVLQWGSDMISKGKTIATNFVNGIIQFVQQLPGKVYSFISQIPQKVLSVGTSLYNAGRNIFNKLWDGIKSIGSSILDWVSGFASKIGDFVGGIVQGFKNIVTGANNAKSAARSIDGSHANGLSYVPFNGYVAELHEGERVLTKQQNKEYNKGKTNSNNSSGDTFVFYNTQPDAYEYARQMKRAKKEILYGV